MPFFVLIGLGVPAGSRPSTLQDVLQGLGHGGSEGRGSEGPGTGKQLKVPCGCGCV